jgi:hypothetical protein
MDKLTRQGVRNLDLVGPRPPKPRRVPRECKHFWTDWVCVVSEAYRGGVDIEERHCTVCGTSETQSYPDW